MAATVTYERDLFYVENVKDSKKCYAVVGWLFTGGTWFQTLERFSMTAQGPSEDFPHLPAGEYGTTAVMYWHSSKGRVLNPYNGTATTKRYNNILFHKGTYPSNFEGCIGPGTLSGAGLRSTLSGTQDALEFIWTQCGGKAGEKPGWTSKALSVALRVLNDFPGASALSPYTSA